MTRGDRLGELEELVLMAVLRLGNEAWGAAVRRELRERADRAPSVSTIYTTLLRLEDKGFATSSFGDSSGPRGGRPKRLFAVTAEGRAELEARRRVRERMWEGIEAAARGSDAG